MYCPCYLRLIYELTNGGSSHIYLYFIAAKQDGQKLLASNEQITNTTSPGIIYLFHLPTLSFTLPTKKAEEFFWALIHRP